MTIGLARSLRAGAGLCSFMLALALAGCGGGSGGGTSGGQGEVPPPSSSTAGTVILAGQLLAAPYVLDVQGTTVRINGTSARSYTAPPAATPMTYDATSPALSAFALVDLAAKTHAAAGGGAAGIQAALAKLQAHPAVAAATTIQEGQATNILVTDKTGSSATMKTSAPDGDARALTDDQRATLAASAAASWTTLLAGGGGLVISSLGDVQMIPAGDIAALLTATDAAFQLSGDARRNVLLDLYQDDAIVDDLLANYKPRPASAAPQSPLSAGPVPRIASFSTQVAAAVGPTGCCKTPGSRIAWVYLTLDGSDVGPYASTLWQDGYRLKWADFRSRHTPGSGWEAFKRTSGAGAIYFVTHSSPSGIALQSYPNVADAIAADVKLDQLKRDGYIRWWRAPDGTWWMDATPKAISTYWRSNDTIVHAASCYSITLADAFNAREFFGYTGISSTDTAFDHSKKLWGRLAGADPGDGSLRQASVAFDGGKGYAPALWLFGTTGAAGRWTLSKAWNPATDPTGATQAAAAGATDSQVSSFAFRDGSPNSDTVVSPAVVQAKPSTPVYVGDEGLVSVGFDALMNTHFSPADVIEIAGCAQRTGTGSWNLDSVVAVPFTATTPGTATVTVHPLGAQSIGGIELDGNGTKDTGVAPNGDPYVYTFQCLASQVPPPPATTAPQVTVAPISLSVVHVMGSSPCPTHIGSFSIGESLDGALNWSITGMPVWLTLGSTHGSLSTASTPSSVSADFNCSVPARGLYTGTLTVTGTPASGESSSKSISVSVDVQ